MNTNNYYAKSLVVKKGYKSNCKVNERVYIIDISNNETIAAQAKNWNIVFLKKDEYVMC